MCDPWERQLESAYKPYPWCSFRVSWSYAKNNTANGNVGDVDGNIGNVGGNTDDANYNIKDDVGSFGDVDCNTDYANYNIKDDVGNADIGW